MDRKTLVAALEIVRPGLATKEIVEQSTSFAFIDDCIVSYNDELSIRHPIPELKLKLNGAIKADSLYQLLSKITRDEIEIEISEKEVLITAGKAHAGLALQTEIRLPVDEITQDVDLKWKKLPNDFCSALDFTTFTCSHDNSKPVLTCVHVSPDFIESSDDFRMTRHDTKLTGVDFLLPCRSAQVVAKYAVTQVAQDSSWVHFKTEKGTCISCRLFEGKFPSATVDKAMKVKGNAFTLPERLIPVLDRAGIFTKLGYAKGAAIDELVSISIKDKKMRIEAKGSSEWFFEDLTVDYTGDPFSFGVNPLFLRQITEQMKKCFVTNTRLKFESEKWEHVIALREG